MFACLCTCLLPSNFARTTRTLARSYTAPICTVAAAWNGRDGHKCADPDETGLDASMKLRGKISEEEWIGDLRTSVEGGIYVVWRVLCMCRNVHIPIWNPVCMAFVPQIGL